jgi:hypothetical protein
MMEIVGTKMVIGILLNVKIDNSEKWDRLISFLTILKGSKNLEISLRIRGIYSSRIHLEFLNSLSGELNLRIYNNSKYRHWNINTLEQILKMESHIILLCQEDHLLVTEIEILYKTIQEFEKTSASILLISWYAQYANFIKNNLSFYNLCTKRTKYLSEFKINSDVHNTNEKPYFVNLVSAYKKEFLIHYLILNTLTKKNYPIDSPFNFEKNGKNVNSKIGRWCFPNSELFACIDDDHGVVGYSLKSRGKFKAEFGHRIYDHHNLSKGMLALKKKGNCAKPISLIILIILLLKKIKYNLISIIYLYEVILIFLKEKKFKFRYNKLYY